MTCYRLRTFPSFVVLSLPFTVNALLDSRNRYQSKSRFCGTASTTDRARIPILVLLPGDWFGSTLPLKVVHQRLPRNAWNH